MGALADSRDRPPRPAPRRSWPPQGLHAAFPAGPREPGGAEARVPPARVDPGSRGGAAAAGQEGVGDRAPGLPGPREPRAAFLSPTSRPAIVRVSSVVVPASVLACVGVFCGLETDVCVRVCRRGWGWGLEASAPQLRVGWADTGLAWLGARVTGPPASQNPGRAPYVVSDTNEQASLLARAPQSLSQTHLLTGQGSEFGDQAGCGGGCWGVGGPAPRFLL